MTVENTAFDTAEAVAPLLGAALEPRGEDTWRGRMTMPDGLQIIIAKPYGSKGKIWAFLLRPGYPGESRKCGGIGADITKDPVKLARDIERRLLPAARAAAADHRARWAEQEAARGELEQLAKVLNLKPDTRATMQNPGADSQHVAVHFFHADKGSLSAQIHLGGSVFVNHLRPYGGAKQLLDIINLLSF